ncbi:MAG: tetratricopeptide repeat protein [Gammaproteobacteria bacterium]|jgi:tetratricopeptide (TPR) repeat protein|nr:tetratricopeptide repeat protein [Gammaproteobacteria bacterium]
MLKFSSLIIPLIAALLLTACQGVPQPAPQPQAEAAETPPPAAPVAAVAVPAEPVPIEFHEQLYGQALAALKSGDTEEALVLLTQLSRDTPDKPYLFTNLGLAYFQLQQSELAEQAFGQAIARNPEDAVAYNHLGILQRRKGLFQEALVQYQRAIEIDSEYARAHFNLGILFDLYLQDLEKALQQYRKYLDLTSEENAQVAGWIVDIERRLKSATTQEQG